MNKKLVCGDCGYAKVHCQDNGANYYWCEYLQLDVGTYNTECVLTGERGFARTTLNNLKKTNKAILKEE